MHTKRLFLAIRPEAEILKEWAAIQQGWREDRVFSQLTKGGRWLTPEQLHLTLHFLGKTPEAALSPLRDALRILPRRPLATQSLNAVIAFPDERRARVAGIGARKAEAGLAGLHQDLANLLKKLTLPVENRPLVPHVSLIRFRNPVTLPSLPWSSLRPLPLDRVTLFESHPDGDGSRYEMIEEVLLAPTA